MSGSPQTPLGPAADAEGSTQRPAGQRKPPEARRRLDPGRIAITLLAAAVAVWLVAKASEDLRQFAVVTLNGITLAALFFVVASGFTLIFGLMRVVNMAHGSLYLFGGYLALEMQDAWFKEAVGARPLAERHRRRQLRAC